MAVVGERSTAVDGGAMWENLCLGSRRRLVLGGWDEICDRCRFVLD